MYTKIHMEIVSILLIYVRDSKTYHFNLLLCSSIDRQPLMVKGSKWECAEYTIL